VFVVLLSVSPWARVAATSSGEGSVLDASEGPISFEPNRGQADTRAQFIARGPGYTLGLTHEGPLLSIEIRVSPEDTSEPSFALRLLGTNSASALVPRGELSTKSSYFVGPDPKNWHTEIPNFARVQFQDAYPGIDVGYQGIHGRLDYDFVIASGAMPGRIEMEFSGGNPQLDTQGNLFLRRGQIEVRLHKPAAYQALDGGKHSVRARYLLRKRKVKFALGAYDLSKPLVIDPVMSYVVHPNGVASLAPTR
jgi:hypothetical protein